MLVLIGMALMAAPPLRAVETGQHVRLAADEFVPDSLHEIVAAIDSRRIEKDVVALVGFGTRHTPVRGPNPRCVVSALPGAGSKPSSGPYRVGVMNA